MNDTISMVDAPGRTGPMAGRGERPSRASRLPVVDISGLRSRNPLARRRAAEALGSAAEEHGFLYI